MQRPLADVLVNDALHLISQDLSDHVLSECENLGVWLNGFDGHHADLVFVFQCALTERIIGFQDGNLLSLLVENAALSFNDDVK